MSKNITIQEGGTAKEMTVEKLKTNLVGGGSCLWVPEDDVALGSKTITENGTFVAADDGLYGYSQVTVSGIGAVAGKIPSGSTLPSADGNEYSVTTTPTGDLEFEKIPSSIKVITPPTKNVYDDGETIIMTGAVVKAFNKDNTVWTNSTYPDGIIPISELNINPSSAIYDPDTDIEEKTDGNGVTVGIYNTGTTYKSVGGWGTFWIGDKIGEAISGQYEGSTIKLGEQVDGSGDHNVLLTTYDGYIYYKLDEEISPVMLNHIYYNSQGNPFINAKLGEAKADVWSRFKYPNNHYSVPESTADPYNAGELEPVSSGSKQTINVSWYRVGDSKNLDTSFEVIVNRPNK